MNRAIVTDTAAGTLLGMAIGASVVAAAVGWIVRRWWL